MKPKKEKQPPIEIPDDSVDPFILSRRAWNKAQMGGGNAIRAWATVAVISMGLLVLELVWANSQIVAPKFIPYMVTVDKQTGEFNFSGMLTQANITVDDNMTRSFLRTFINKVRSVSSDPYVVKNNVYESFFYCTQAGQNKLASMYLNYDPVNMNSKRKTVDLIFETYNHVSEKTWYVRWTEVESSSGNVTARIPRSGTFTFTKAEPASDQAALINPVTIAITDFYITDVKGDQ